MVPQSSRPNRHHGSPWARPILAAGIPDAIPMMIRFLALFAPTTLLAACLSMPTLPQNDAAWTADRYIASVWMLPAEAGPASQLTMRAMEIDRLRAQKIGRESSEERGCEDV